MKKFLTLDTGILRGGLWLTTEKVILLGKGLLLAYLCANWLSKEVYGGYQFFLAFLGVISILATPGMGLAIVHALARGEYGTFPLAVRVIIRTSLFGSALLLLTAGYYFHLGMHVWALLFLMLSVIFPGYIAMNLWRYYYTGTSEFHRLVKTSVLFETFSLATMLIAIFYFPHLIPLIILGIIIPIIPSLALVGKLMINSRGQPQDKTALVFGKKISYSVGLSTLATYADKLLLGHFLGFAPLAIYSVAMIIPEQTKGIIASFMVPLLPRYSSEGTNVQLKKHFVWFSLLSVAAAGMFYFLLPIIFHFVFPLYTGGLIYAKSLLILIAFIPFTLFETFCRSQRNERAIFRATLSGSAATLVLALLCIPWLGIWGAILSRIGGNLVQSGSLTLSLLPSKPGKPSHASRIL